MRKAFFAGKGKRKIHKRHSDENLSYSTDRRDLPDGFTVGSMSVPFVPQSPELAAEEQDLQRAKRKKSKEVKIKDRHKFPLPVISRPIIVPGKLDSNEIQDLSQLAVKIESSPITMKRMDWAQKQRLQRSCSVDALDEMDNYDEEILSPNTPRTPGTPGTPGTPDSTPGTPEIHLRRCSTEIEREVRSFHPDYHRGVSYNTAVVRPKRSLYKRPRRSLHGDTHLELLKSSYAPKTPPSRSNAQQTLHEPKSVEHLLEALQSPGVDVNMLDERTGNAPIHSIIKRKKKDRLDLLLALLINSGVDIDLQNSRDMTALHMAIESGSEKCLRATIVFGADINKEGCNQFTALDLVAKSGRFPAIETILKKLEAKRNVDKIADCQPKKIPRLFSFAQKMKPPKKEERLKNNDKISEYINSRGMPKLYNELEITVVRRLSISATIGGADDAFALVLQQRELALYNRTQPKPKKRVGTAFGLRGGSRILFLDGGGIKGLVQLEVLIQLEERTQCKITDLFDWIVGTSTGGVIALAMVYGKKSLRDLRQLYFLMKNRIFMKSRYGYGYSSDALEEILKTYLNPEMKMSDVKHPKVLIAAVNKATTNLELHFFNNCFDDEYSEFPVWKVARYTSAAPMFFNEYDNYVDGGVICNNPTDYGLTAIQNYCRLTDNNIPIAVVVSIGTGVYPAEKMGSVDAQDALFFGKRWLNPGKLLKQTQNLMSLLSNALVESELVANNSRSRCKEQDVPFFRFSPKFDELIAAGETDNEKLFNMIINTKLYLKQVGREFDELVNLFHAVAESSKDLDQDVVRKNVEPQILSSHPIKEEEEEEGKEGEGDPELPQNPIGVRENDREEPTTTKYEGKHETKEGEESSAKEKEEFSTKEEEEPKDGGMPATKEAEGEESSTPDGGKPAMKEGEESSTPHGGKDEGVEPTVKEEEELSTRVVNSESRPEAAMTEPSMPLEEKMTNEEKPVSERKKTHSSPQGAVVEKSDPSTQVCKLIDQENEVCPLKPSEFTENFLFNSICSALGARDLELSHENSPLPSKAPSTNSSETASSYTRPVATVSHTPPLGQHSPVNPRIQKISRNRNQQLQLSATELYKPYRTDTNKVDESVDEYTDHKRETLV